MLETEKPINYNFEHKYNRFEINVSEGRALPLLVLSSPIYSTDGHTLHEKGVLYMGDYIVDDFIALHPTIKDNWFIISTTQSHVIPSSLHPDLHLYTTQDGESSPQYRHAATKNIPDLILGCGHYVDTEAFYPEPETLKVFDLIYISKWAPTKRIEHILDAAKADPSLNIAILGFPVVSERKRAASDNYRQLILNRINEEQISNVKIIEHVQEKHINADGTEVVGGFTKDEIRHFFNQAHCTVLTADANEAINRALAEALCCDIPIMLTNDTLGGAKTLINDKTGIFIEPTGLAITKGIRYLKENREKFSPRTWYSSHYGQEKSNRRLRTRIAEIALQSSQLINITNMRPYLGDLWSYEYYQYGLDVHKTQKNL